jgi:hypothetical protein
MLVETVAPGLGLIDYDGDGRFDITVMEFQDQVNTVYLGHAATGPPWAPSFVSRRRDAPR